MKYMLIGAPLTLAVVLLAIHILLGAYKKMSCSVVRVVIMVATLLLSCPISLWLAGIAGDFLCAKLPDASAAQTVEQLREQLPVTYALCRASVQALLAPAFYLFIFILLYLILLIPGAAVRRALDRLSPTLAGRHALPGVAIGLVCGVMACVVAFAPATGYTTLLHDTASAAQEAGLTADNPDAQWGQITEADRTVLEPMVNSLPQRAIRAIGSKALFRYMTTVTVDGTRVAISDDLPRLATFAVRVQRIFETFSGDAADVGELALLADDLDASEMLRRSAAEIFSTASEAWLTGGTFLGNTKPAAYGVEEIALNWTLEQFRTTTPETVAQDVRRVATTMSGMLRVQEKAQELLPQGTSDLNEESITALAEGLLGEELTAGLTEIAGGVPSLSRDADAAELLTASAALLTEAKNGTDAATLTEKIAATAGNLSIELTPDQCAALSDLLLRYPVDEETIECFAALGNCADVLEEWLAQMGK